MKDFAAMKTPNLICVFTLIASIALVTASQAEPTNAPAAKPAADSASTNEVAVIKTSDGTMVVSFWPDVAPNTVANFEKLARKGFYDGTCFHRIMKGFMIQGGDPNGIGTGGESAWGGTFNDEINASSDLYKGAYKKGTVAMANRGPNTNGAQFFIMHVDYPLPPSYAKFGRVIEGQDVVDAIAEVETGHGDKPTSPVVMEKVTIEE